MYNGTIKKVRKQDYKLPKTATILSMEEEIVDGAIFDKIKYKTIKLESDENLYVRDFDITNLRKSGAINELKETKLTPSLNKIEANAHEAGKVLDQIELIQELEKEQSNNLSNEQPKEQTTN